MNKILLTLILVLAGALIFVSGGLIFLSLRNTKLPGSNPMQSNSNSIYETTVKNLSSQVIDSTLAYGKVSAISGKNVTLSNGSASMIFVIPDSAEIYTIAPATKTNKQVMFGQIKMGDDLSVHFKILPDASMVVSYVFIAPK